MKRFVTLLSIAITVLAGCQRRQPQIDDSTPQQHDSFTPTSAVVATLEMKQTIAVTPVPEYLGVRPMPGAVHSEAEYQNLAPSLEWGATVPCVCVGVDPLGLLDPGDSPTTEEWLARTHLIVDNNTIAEYHSILMTDLQGKEVRDAETGELLFKTPPGSPFRICYAASLEVGLHMATFVVEKPSGEEWSYTWQFVITE